MTSIEALNTILSLSKDAQKFENCIQAIRKDLDMIELLRNSIYYREQHKRMMSDPIGEPFIMLSINVHGEENVKKIKEWADEKR